MNAAELCGLLDIDVPAPTPETLPEPEPEEVTRVRLKAVPPPKAKAKDDDEQRGWVNGGLGSKGADNDANSKTRDQRDVPGIPAYLGVERSEAGGGAIAELAWFYCASAFEIGMSSSHDMMVQQLNIGGPPTSGGAAPRPPNPIAMNAASCQRRVRERLSYVPQSLRSQLERAYSDRRYPAELVTVYELGIAPIVWRAQHDAEDAAGHKRPGNATLLRLVELVRVWWPTYEEVGDRLPSRIFHAADTILWTAHVMYGEHLGGPRRIARTPRPHKRRRMAPELHRAGEFGAASRRLVGEIFAA